MSFVRGSFLGNAKGATGPAGPAGTPGAAGEPGIVWAGVWSSSTTYAVGDAVAWNGSSFVCTTTHTNHEPPDDVYWDVLASAGVDGGDAVPYAVELDDAGGGVTYVGKADPGTATSTAGWQIQRITESAGDVTVEWADGDALFNNVWDNRLSLAYT